MTNISVEYLDHMGNDLMVSNVARVSFNKWKNELEDGDVKLINYLAAHEHSSPFRHPQIQVRCKAPVFLARQLQKHAVGLTWNEVSRRYVDTDVEFFVPDCWRSRPDGSVKQGSGGVVEDSWQFTELLKDHHQRSLDIYEDMLKVGIAPEMARMVLPQSMMVTWVWTGSLAAFFHVYRLRSGEGAQEEAKEFAQKLEEVIQPIFSHSWKALKNVETN